MTTGQRSQRSSWLGAVALVLLAGGVPSAHRRDEYLQAARVAIDPDRLEIELDLTPGIAVAEQMLAEIDRDGNRSISDAEAHAYRGQVLGAMVVDVDGTPLSLELIDSSFPDVAAVLNGAGTMRFRAVAALPRVSAGTHHLRYRNSHRPDIGVYLANALVPSSDRVAIVAQRRDPDQRDLMIEYTLEADPATRVRGGLSAGAAGAAIWLTSLWWRRRRESV
jgi:hypothetical protein